MVEVSVAENNASLNIEQLLKVPENKIEQVLENISDL